MLIALPVGIWLGHIRRAAFLATSIGNLGRAIPDPGDPGHPRASIPAIGVGDLAAILALAVFAIPPMLTSAMIVGVPATSTRMCATPHAGMGMTGGQVLRGVELPLAAPSILSGVRTSLVQVVATVSLAALVGFRAGSALCGGRVHTRQDQTLVLVGALLVSVLAIATDRAAGWGTRLLSPRGIRFRQVRAVRRRARGGARPGRPGHPPPRAPHCDGPARTG